MLDYTGGHDGRAALISAGEARLGEVRFQDWRNQSAAVATATGERHARPRVLD
jgi:hypothetical protein